ncbi:hypothetical protein HUO09_04990 [Vibrio sp. Y2-5]|uniref:hypothetical protein n=1 Tax=Vibrio TaxID=662 RepID=UPI00142DB26E|nr:MULTISPECIES: hypothetical protein [Vibrio]MBD0785685.1 hypothetical protein [Vibrio sp. Y2-5]NIY93292.1 hypothetical protein [Vibrio diazotrophicus]
MAAEKLTKHRLAQIIVTLALLLVAFFWRTITYTEFVTVTCSPQPNCFVFVNNQKITVTKNDRQSGVLNVYPIPLDWDVTYDGEWIRNAQNVVLFPKADKVNNVDAFIINNSVKVQVEN